ncbi:MAG: serine protease [Lentimicrobium sp.]
MITSNVLTRTFHLKNGQNIGTCFTVDLENKQYFVTAKHVIQDITTDGIIELYHEGKWIKGKATITGHSVVSDVSVFALNYSIGGHSLPPTSGGIIYGQDLYFLGFPYGLKAEIGELNRDFPLPLVKKGILSAIIGVNPGRYFLIDGHNNPGFSGGPVVFNSPNQKEFKVGGIISGYRYEFESAYLNQSPTQIQVRTNTGIIIAYAIENALDIIKQNPNGKELPV